MQGLYCFIGALLISLGESILMCCQIFNYGVIVQLFYSCLFHHYFQLYNQKKLHFEQDLKLQQDGYALSNLFHSHQLPLCKSYTEFLVYYLAILLLGFSLIAFPTIISLWSNFDEKDHEFLTFLIFGFHPISHICFSYLIPQFLNPHDLHPTEHLENSYTKFNYFRSNVAKGFYNFIWQICSFSGLLIFIGSLLISHKTNNGKKTKINPLVFLLDNLYIEDDIYKEKDVDIQLIPKIFDFKYLFITICYTILMTLILTITNYFKFYAITNFKSDHKVTKINLVSDICKILSHFPWNLIIFEKVQYQTIFTSIMIVSGLFAVFNSYLGQNIVVFSISYIFFMMIDKGIKLLVGSKMKQVFDSHQRAQLKPYLMYGLMFARFLTDFSTLNLKQVNFYGIIQFQGCLILVLLLIFKSLNYNGLCILANIQ